MARKVSRRINKIAKGITRVVGGANLAEFAGAKIAKATSPKSQRKHISSKATGKQAVRSAFRVGLVVAGGAGLARAAIKKAAKTAGKTVAKRQTLRSFKVKGQDKRVTVARTPKARMLSVRPTNAIGRRGISVKPSTRTRRK